MSNNVHHIDFSDLQIVGRNHEIQQLQSAFDKICDTKTCGVALVHGVSGTGKSLLVQTALQKLPKARFCSGKFDPHGISQPYSAIVEALSDLCDQIQHDEHIQAALQNRLEASSSMVLPEMIPGVAELMGWSRSSRSFGSSVLDRHEWNSKQVKKELKVFLQVVCRPSTPCIIFIDDLQWADTASLELLHFIICNGQVQGLFFCGAFRDNEIDSSFPFAAELQGNNNVTTIHVEELTLASINELIAGLFKRGVSAETFELSQVVMKRTHGNAFYVIQFLRCLQGEGYFEYSASTGHFEWDLAKIQSHTSASDNVIAFMQRKLERLPIETREVLKVAACFGSQFDDQIVEHVCGGCSETSSRLQVAIDEGLVAKRRRSSGFKFAHDQIRKSITLHVGLH
jgi:predicted ATPase